MIHHDFYWPIHCHIKWAHTSAYVGNYIYYWWAHARLWLKYFHGPIRIYSLSTLNGPTWALSRHMANCHMGSTDHYGQGMRHGLHKHETPLEPGLYDLEAIVSSIDLLYDVHHLTNSRLSHFVLACTCPAQYVPYQTFI